MFSITKQTSVHYITVTHDETTDKGQNTVRIRLLTKQHSTYGNPNHRELTKM